MAGYLVVSAIVAYLLLRIYAGREALLALGPNWNPTMLAASAITALLAYQALFVAWLMMLRRAGYFRREYVSRYARVWWVSYLYRYVPGKVLLVVERARLGAPLGIPPAAGAAMPVIETLLAVLAGCAVSLLAVAWYLPDPDRALLGIVGMALAIVVLLPIAYRFMSEREWVRNRYPELASIAFSSRDLLVLSIPFLVHYLVLGTAFYLFAATVYPLPLSDLPGICGIFALSHVLGLVALFAPGGLGVREGALAVQLDHMVPAGIADALALGARAWFMAIELVCYFAVLAVSRGDISND